MKQLAAQSRESLPSGLTARRRPHESGYIMLTLMLVVAIMSVFALAVITEMKFTMKRDQEGEMIHRGVQYSRAIRGYYKKFGRYPTRLEDLENTNNMRYLRKRYKDPLKCKDGKCQDFRLLHFGEQGVTVGSGGLSFGGGTIPGANAIGGAPGANGSSPSGSAFGGPSSFGGSSPGGSSFGAQQGSGVNNSGVFSQGSGFGSNSGVNPNGAFGSNSNSQTNPGQPGTNGTAGSDPTQTGAPAPGASQGDSSSISGSQQPVAGGPIVGVASLSKDNTIREFNKKRKYNEWQFVYDPTNEPRNGLITTPNQPQLQGFGQQPLQGATPAGSSSSSPFGQSSSFGQSGGFGNNGNSGTPVAPVQPPPNPPQQQ